MRARTRIPVLVLACVAASVLALASCETQQAPGIDRAFLLAQRVTPQLGGDTTRIASGDHAFTFLAANAPEERARVFSFGNRLFNTNWVEAPASVKAFDGLGPTFNRVSCSGCHTRDGRGRPPSAPGDPLDSMLIRLSLPGVGPHGGPLPVPGYGDQLNDRANPGVAAEGRAIITYEEIVGTYGDGTQYTLRRPSYAFRDLAYGSLDGALISPRVAPQVIGLGLLEAVPEPILRNLEDPDDADGDGVSGRLNIVWDAIRQREAIGRFGWKANKASLMEQDAGAANGDIGLTTSVFQRQNCPDGQTACAAAFAQDGPEMSDAFLQKLTVYSQTLAVPVQRDATSPAVRRGEELFRNAGCAACHMPTLVTDETAALPELRNQTFHPFTDLLLHDMGEGLADGRPDFGASRSEWRTPPLWGIGLIESVNFHTLFLHDGRARGFEEAILWHGGEAEQSKEKFRTMSADDRAALVAFLKSL